MSSKASGRCAGGAPSDTPGGILIRIHAVATLLAVLVSVGALAACASGTAPATNVSAADAVEVLA